MRQTDIRKQFGSAIRKLRLDRNWTQEEFAERIGMDRSYIGQVERGKRNISILNIQLIAEGFGISVASLFSRL